MKTILSALCSLVAFSIFCGSGVLQSGPPVLTGISPSQVYPGQIVLVNGANLEQARVLWIQNNRFLPQSQSVTNYFQVPHDAPPGNFTVRMKNDNGESSPCSITVLPLHTGWPAPRIEDIGINSYQSHGDGTADFYLAVSAANVDAEARVVVNSRDCPSTFYSAIPSGVMSSPSANPRAYGYPVFHYVTLIVYVPNQPFNRNLDVTVNNIDGAFGKRVYAIPDSTYLDSDGDGLLDDWEINGYPVPGTGDRISLDAMGCDARHKDILVQVDWMRSAEPDASIWRTIENIFANAPVLNPDGSQGIRIHIDHGQDAQGLGQFWQGGKSIRDYPTIDFCDYVNLPNHATFGALKNSNFDAARTDLFHYCIFANGRPDGSTGRAEIWGDDFMVTFAGTDPEDWANPNAQIGTFIHELGHNLGLYHGGLDRGLPDYHERFKWNQRSSMNYRYQLTGVPVDRDGNSNAVTHTYSEGIDTTILEAGLDSRAMREAMGVEITGQDVPPRGLNTNGGPVKDRAMANWNPEETDAVDTLINDDEWGSIKLNFRDTASGRTTLPCTSMDQAVKCNQITLIFTDTLNDGCQAYRIRLDGTVSIDGGLCAPPKNCGITFPCVPPGDYMASALSMCDSTRFYWSTTDTVSKANDTKYALRIHIVQGVQHLLPYRLVITK